MRKCHLPSLSPISRLHYFKLFFRSGLFLLAAGGYIYNRIHNTGEIFGGLERHPPLLITIWIIFAVEIILRFFPSRFESMGCQKQFAKNYLPASADTGADPAKQRRPRSTVIVAVFWFLLNGIIGVLYLTSIIDQGILLLICLAYSVCDMICILFFCPFQTWIMKNKCCGSCRIYNWDYAMMFTPLIFVNSLYTWSILALSVGLLVKWEIVFHRHPERFSETTNTNLSCINCEEKLCSHKKSLQRFLKRQKEFIRQEADKLYHKRIH